MLDQSLKGGFAQPAQDSAHAFRAAMSVMARPGTIEEIALAEAPEPVSPAAAALLLVLCDHETPLYLADGHDTVAVRDWVTFHTGAPLVERAAAQIALGRWEALLPVTDFAIGTQEYPDRSATLIVEQSELISQGNRLTGPGIKDSAALNLPDQRPFQNNRLLFPLGLDFYFTAGTQLAALPRTTRVEAD